jgi:hypothetical protein
MWTGLAITHCRNARPGPIRCLDCLPPWASPPMNAETLRDVLLQVVKTHEAQLGRRDVYGQRYIVDFFPDMARATDHGMDTLRLTTCYPL